MYIRTTCASDINPVVAWNCPAKRHLSLPFSPSAFSTPVWEAMDAAEGSFPRDNGLGRALSDENSSRLTDTDSAALLFRAIIIIPLKTLTKTRAPFGGAHKNTKFRGCILQGGKHVAIFLILYQFGKERKRNPPRPHHTRFHLGTHVTHMHILCPLLGVLLPDPSLQKNLRMASTARVTSVFWSVHFHF
jgi:hypothetical protein